MCVEVGLLPLVLDKYISRLWVKPSFSRFLRRMGTVPSGPFSTPSMANSGVAWDALCRGSCNSRSVTAGGGAVAMIP